MSRAKSILEEGFRCGVGKKIFFTRNHTVARRYALTRARDADDEPAIIMCSIDLNQYNCYERRDDKDAAVVFRHRRIGSEVVIQVITVAGRNKKLRSKNNTSEFGK